MALHVSNADSAKLHIKEIRSNKFSIGKKESNPLTKDLHHAVTSLSAELYTKDVHFLMELIQNAEDNEYEENVEPTLEFLLTKEDITGIGSPATLLIFNNEVGFSKKNIESLCSVGRSTKKGKRQQGYIGEKGIGFKSVFLVCPQPHIFSNGYRIKFNEKPDPDCGIGYIVPKWVSEKPSLSDIRRLCSTNNVLPKTIFVLPLKPEKVEAVRAQLSELHPEILLFLSRVKRLYVHEDRLDSRKQENVSIISICSESNQVKLSGKSGDSRVVQLSVEEMTSDGEETCKYFMWREAFPVKLANRVDSRKDVNEWIITLAFPFGNRLKRGSSSVGIFAYLPTAMVTNFPFVIQADFILSSSRESILMDNPWNLGIMECVPSAFVNAFTACNNTSIFSSLEQVCSFLPAQASSYEKLNKARDRIREKLKELRVVPCELFDGKRHFEKPRAVVRIFPEFRSILSGFKKSGGSLFGLQELKKISYLEEKHSSVLDFLGVKSLKKSIDWYKQCTEACNLADLAPPMVYIELLCFLHEKRVLTPSFRDVPLLKYTNEEGEISLCSISQLEQGELTIVYASKVDLHLWLSKCNDEFGCPSNIFFMPLETLESLLKHHNSHYAGYWLKSSAQVKASTASDYFTAIFKYVSRRSDLTVLLLHFIYHAHKQKFIDNGACYWLCSKVPIVDGSGIVRSKRSVTLVSRKSSKWARLFGSRNPFSEQDYVDIGDKYAKGGLFLGKYTPNDVVLEFMYKYGKAVDLPDICPPNVEFHVASSELSMEQAFLLLDWIRFLQTKGSNIPEKFIASIQSGKWMYTSTGFSSPSQCIFPDEAGRAVYDTVKNVIDGISVIDLDFYGNKMSIYQDELKFIGVSFGSNDVQALITAQFLSADASRITKEWTFSLLEFIHISSQRNVIDKQWLQGMNKKKWLKTLQGFVSPEGSVFIPGKPLIQKSFLKLANLPVVDEKHYGSELISFSSELQLVGVAMNPGHLYKLLEESAMVPNDLSDDRGCAIVILRCIKYLGSTAASGLINRIKDQPWLQTTCGLKCPSEITLPNSELKSVVIALGIPVIDESYYFNGISKYVNELRAIEVAVDNASVFEMIRATFSSLLLSSELSSEIVLSALGCLKELSKTMSLECAELKWLSTEKWLKTCHGFKTTKESILSSLKWESLLPFVDLPLIDDFRLHEYKDVLKMLGVITDFESGAKHVLNGLKSPIEPEFITADNIMALLECLKYMMSKSIGEPIPESFLKNFAESRCLKTTTTLNNFVLPKECVLFDYSWGTVLSQTDLPCIDVGFYSSDIFQYKDQLRAIGVKTYSTEVCSFISRILFSQTETSIIKRFYSFLQRFQWKPDKLDKSNFRVWIPSDDDRSHGTWVNSEMCVLHDSDDLFASHLYSLFSYYEAELLPLFSSAFGVREFLSVSDYLKLWNDWGSNTIHQVTHLDCYFFWDFVSKHWSSDTEETLKQSLTKISATTCSDRRIHFVNKDQVFIADDLRLKALFSDISVPLFVWFPTHEGPAHSLTLRLKDIYRALGVKRISDSVISKSGIDFLSAGQQKNLVSRNDLIKKGLLKIILGFLAGPRFYMSAKERRETLTPFLSLKVFQSDEPIKFTYSLAQSSAVRIEVETKKMVFWDKRSGRLFIDKSGYENRKTDSDFGSELAREIAEGLLAPKGIGSEALESLCKIIHLGFAYEFDEHAVDRLLLGENLEFMAEDYVFLSDAISCFKPENKSVVHGKRGLKALEIAPPTPPKKRCKSEL